MSHIVDVVTSCRLLPIYFYRQRAWEVLHIEARQFSEPFPDFQDFILRWFTQYRFHATTAGQGHSKERKSTLVLILGCPLLICTKSKFIPDRNLFSQQTRWFTTKNLFAMSFRLFSQQTRRFTTKNLFAMRSFRLDCSS